jgi:O-antigen/teichoic acid export membrane protein
MSKSGSAVSNVQWVAIAQAGRVGISIVSITVFARLLPASDFGLLAMATIVTNFASIIRDMGTAAALIQKSELTDELVDTVFWSNVVFGILSGGLLALGSPLIAWAFREPALQTVLILLSLAFPLNSSGAAHLALLERTGRFRGIAIVEIFSGIVGAGVGIVAAWKGAGIISLILQIMITAAISTCLFWVLSRWRPTLRWSRKEFLGLLHFSGNLVGFNIINYFARNADGMLIGRFLGPLELGLYNIAYRIMLFPLQNLTSVANRAFFPIFSGQQHDPELIGRNYLKLLTLISLITAPLMLGLWSVREPFVEIVLGEKWRAATAIVAWLAPTGYLQSLVSTTGSVLMARGRTRLMRNLGVVCSLIYLASFALGVTQGAAGVARAYFFANLVTSAIYLHYTLVQVNLKLADLARSIFRPLMGALMMVSLVLAADHWLLPEYVVGVMRLTCLVVLGAGLYLLFLVVGARDVLREVRRLLMQKRSS